MAAGARVISSVMKIKTRNPMIISKIVAISIIVVYLCFNVNFIVNLKNMVFLSERAANEKCSSHSCAGNKPASNVLNIKDKK
jgi:hypothetical protein